MIMLINRFMVHFLKHSVSDAMVREASISKPKRASVYRSYTDHNENKHRYNSFCIFSLLASTLIPQTHTLFNHEKQKL